MIDFFTIYANINHRYFKKMKGFPLLRSFLAIEIPKVILENIEKLQKDLKSSHADIKWVDPEKIHLTVKFFGNIEESKIEPIIKSVESVTKTFSPFKLSVKGIGGFPNLKSPRVIWIGVIDEDGVLAKFQAQLETHFEKIGFEAEQRDFRPHLTLGRMKSLKRKDELINRIERFKDNDFGVFKVERVILFKSDLTKEGPIYTALKEVRFKS